MNAVRLGIENFLDYPPPELKGKRLGLLCNPASTCYGYFHSRYAVDAAFKGQLKALFAPQHGFFAEKQDNMIESAHLTDPKLNIPVYSLYGEVRKPKPAILDDIDVLLVDLPDVGTRVYTFIYTMAYCMQAAKENGKQIIVLDRPNPIGGLLTEGNILDLEFKSFVGLYPIPMRHGLTIAELALFFNDICGIGCDLKVVPMKGWTRDMQFPATGLPWVIPSPNMPTYATALVYPGQVLLEGANLSEARGTTLPFEQWGAPYLDPDALEVRNIPGCVLREVVFEPTSGKWAGNSCKGFQIHVTDADDFKPYLTTLKLLQQVIKTCGDDFQWKQPPYEYEFEKLPIDIIFGDKNLRRHLENGDNLDDVAQSWQKDLDNYNKLADKCKLYSF